MLAESDIYTAKQRLIDPMRERVSAFASESGSAITGAVKLGVIDAPETRERIDDLIRREFQERAALCAGTFFGVLSDSNAEPIEETNRQLRELTAEALDFNVADLAKVFSGVLRAASSREGFTTLSEYREDAIDEVGERIDVALRRFVASLSGANAEQ